MAEVSVWVGGLTEDVTSEMIKGEFMARGIENMTDCHKPAGRSNFGFVRFKTMAEAKIALETFQEGGLSIAGMEVQMKLAESKKNGGAGWGNGGGWGGGGGGWGASSWDPWGMSSWGMSSWGPYGGGKGFDKGGGKGKGKGGKGGGGTWNGEYSIWVGNLEAGTSSEELKEAVMAVGIDTMSDVYVPPGKMFGFIRFSDYDKALEASKLAERGVTVRGEIKDAVLSNTEKHNPAKSGGGGSWGW